MADDGKRARFDAAEYLEYLDHVAAYLEIALQESAKDPSAVRGFGLITRPRNMSELARRVGMSRDGLYKAFSRWQPDLAHHREKSPTRSACASNCTPSPSPATRGTLAPKESVATRGPEPLRVCLHELVRARSSQRSLAVHRPLPIRRASAHRDRVTRRQL